MRLMMGASSGIRGCILNGRNKIQIHLRDDRTGFRAKVCWFRDGLASLIHRQDSLFPSPSRHSTSRCRCRPRNALEREAPGLANPANTKGDSLGMTSSMWCTVNHRGDRFKSSRQRSTIEERRRTRPGSGGCGSSVWLLKEASDPATARAMLRLDSG